MEYMGRRYVPSRQGSYRRHVWCRFSIAVYRIGGGRTDTADLLLLITDPAHWSESEMRIWLERVRCMMMNEGFSLYEVNESI